MSDTDQTASHRAEPHACADYIDDPGGDRATERGGTLDRHAEPEPLITPVLAEAIGTAVLVVGGVGTAVLAGKNGRAPSGSALATD